MPVAGLVLAATRAADEAKLGAALARLVEEDPSYRIDARPDMSETVLIGQGARHLALAVERLKLRFGIEVETRPPRIAFREAPRRPVPPERCPHHGLRAHPDSAAWVSTVAVALTAVDHPSFRPQQVAPHLT